jgi:hypothetical protein
MSIPNLQSLPSLEDGVVVDQIAQQVINFEQTLLDESALDNSLEEEAQTSSTEHQMTDDANPDDLEEKKKLDD